MGTIEIRTNVDIWAIKQFRAQFPDAKENPDPFGLWDFLWHNKKIDVKGRSPGAAFYCMCRDKSVQIEKKNYKDDTWIFILYPEETHWLIAQWRNLKPFLTPENFDEKGTSENKDFGTEKTRKHPLFLVPLSIFTRIARETYPQGS